MTARSLAAQSFVVLSIGKSMANRLAYRDSEAEACELLHAIGRGDERAFAEFYRLYEKRLYHFIYTKLNHSFEAADILHVTFMQVWHSADKFEGRSKVSSWLFGIAYHKVLDYLRKHRPDQLDDGELEKIADDKKSALTCLLEKEQSAAIRRCIDQLKPRQKAVIELALYDEMAYGEIAKIVDAPENTIKTRIFHAKQSLKNCLQAFFAGERS